MLAGRPVQLFNTDGNDIESLTNLPAQRLWNGPSQNAWSTTPTVLLSRRAPKEITEMLLQAGVDSTHGSLGARFESGRGNADADKRGSTPRLVTDQTAFR